MSTPTAYEQYLLELINIERARVGIQPLAFDGDLNEAADAHSDWMLATDTFSHTGSGGASPGQRMTAAGYVFSGSWGWGENIAWATMRSPTGYQDEVLLLHTNLMNSSGHRANILNGSYREAGLGFEIGDYRGMQVAMLTEDFARTGTSSFLTGVAFNDRDSDRSYDVGEGLGGITVKAVNGSGAIYTTTTAPDAGGYDIALPAGTYTVTFSGASIATKTMQATIGTQNLKLDLLGSAAQPPPPPPSGEIVGTDAANSLVGTAGNDTIKGLGGNDQLSGRNGNDTLIGGTGNDTMRGEVGNDILRGEAGIDFLDGGTGADTLTGGADADRFLFTNLQPGVVDRITDFSAIQDSIGLDDAAFTAAGHTGTLALAAFYVGAAAHDATDRIIYNASSGALIYDPDGSGAAAGVVFAQLSAGLALQYNDILIV